MRRLYYLLLVVISYSSCSDDDIIVLSTCPEGATFAIDYRPDFFFEKYLWLTEADGDVAFDEEVDTGLPGLQFLNFENACDDQYTISIGDYQTQQGPDPEDFQQFLSVKEYQLVPQGSVLDFRNARTNPDPFRGTLPEAVLSITGCPPIDSLIFQVEADPLVFGLPDPLFTYQYLTEERTLLLSTELVSVLASNALLAIRDAASGAWRGFNLDLRFGLPDSQPFDDFDPIIFRSLTLEWPATAQDLEWELRWINDPVGRRTMLLAKGEGTNQLEVPLLEYAQGPFLFTARWLDDNRREIRFLLDSWPEDLNIQSTIEGEVLNFDYPVLDIATSGSNIMIIEGTHNNTSSNARVQRSFLGLDRGGTQQIQFAPLSPMLHAMNTQVNPLFERGFNSSSTLSLFQYPAMGSSYSWYFRNVASERSDTQDWLESLTYERLTLPFQ